MTITIYGQIVIVTDSIKDWVANGEAKSLLF